MGSFPSGLAGSAIRAFADQALYSLSNLVLTLALAHRLELRAYGIFAVIMTSSFIAVASLRAVTTERAALELRVEGRPVSATAIVDRLGPVFAGLGVLSALSLAVAVGARPGPLILTVMLAPLIALVDLTHSALVLSGSYSIAAPANLLWLVVVGVTIPWSTTAGSVLAGWTAGAVLALAVMAGRLMSCPPSTTMVGPAIASTTRIRRWPILVDHLGPRLLNQAAFLALAAAGGFSQAGPFRLAQTFVGPLDLLMIASLPLGVASLAGVKPDSADERALLQRLEMTLASLSGAFLVIGALAVISNPWSVVRPASVPLGSVLPAYAILGIRSLAGVAAVGARLLARQSDSSLDLARNEMTGAGLSLALLVPVAAAFGGIDATVLAAVLAIGTLLVVHRQRSLVDLGGRLGLVGGV